MKKTTLLLFSFLMAVSVKAQDKIPVANPRDTNAHKFIFDSVEKEAEFPGGAAAWRGFLMRNLAMEKLTDLVSIPKGQKDLSYKATVSFVVEKDGSLSDIKVKNNVPSYIAQEAIRVMKKSPNWIPAVVKGKPVRAYRVQPIVFFFAS